LQTPKRLKKHGIATANSITLEAHLSPEPAKAHTAPRPYMEPYRGETKRIQPVSLFCFQTALQGTAGKSH